jgi:hypothetical protein
MFSPPAPLISGNCEENPGAIFHWCVITNTSRKTFVAYMSNIDLQLLQSETQLMDTS